MNECHCLTTTSKGSHFFRDHHLRLLLFVCLGIPGAQGFQLTLSPGIIPYEAQRTICSVGDSTTIIHVDCHMQGKYYPCCTTLAPFKAALTQAS